LKNFRGQLILLLSGSIILGILSSLFTSHYFLKKEAIHDLNNQIRELEVLILNSFKEQENYFNFELGNENYFINHQSKYLNHYEKLIQEVHNQIGKIEGQNELLNPKATIQLQKIKADIIEYDSIFDEIVFLVKKRGFRDYGLEGEMRKNVHQLENVAELRLSDVLTLRRHEKDFIMRQDSLYIKKLLRKQLEMKNQLMKSLLPKKQKDSIRQILENYKQQFLLLAKLEHQIGLKTNRGLKNQLNQTTLNLTEKLKRFEQTLKAHQQKILAQQNLFQLTVWAIYILFAIYLILHFSRKFTSPLQALSKRINYFVNTNFTARLMGNRYEKNDELGLLWENFLKMEKEIIEYLDLFKEKVDEKTQELSVKNKEIEEQKNKTEEKNKDLMDAMKYGWKLQRSMLPSPERLKKQLGHAFVFFQPKDIVSGDIYWAHKSIRKEGVEHILAVVDCTGHGVPGAFMSILAMNALKDAVITKKHNQVHHIVQSVNNFVYQSMKYYLNGKVENHTKEGMDLLVCKLNAVKLQLDYCGANRPLYLSRNKSIENNPIILQGKLSNSHKQLESESAVLFEVKPTKKTAGTLSESQSMIFENNCIMVQPNDMIYLTTDGYADQFGGPKSKKLLVKKLKKLFLKIHHQNIKEQENLIKATFLNWKNTEDQIDDVTVLGLRV